MSGALSSICLFTLETTGPALQANFPPAPVLASTCFPVGPPVPPHRPMDMLAGFFSSLGLLSIMDSTLHTARRARRLGWGAALPGSQWSLLHSCLLACLLKLSHGCVAAVCLLVHCSCRPYLRVCSAFLVVATCFCCLACDGADSALERLCSCS